MCLKNYILVGLTIFIKPIDNYVMKLNNTKQPKYEMNLEIKQPPMVEIKKKETNVICSDNKYLTYTNIDNISLSNFELNAWYIDNQGFVRENGTNAIYCAMATNYKKNNYYTITTSDNQSFKVKVVDIKSNEHTTNSCYTTHDNSIVELWLTNNNNNFKGLGNSGVVGVSVIDIKE